jgi:hypothetical protein
MSVAQVRALWSGCRDDDAKWDKAFTEMRPNPDHPNGQAARLPKWFKIWGRVDRIDRNEQGAASVIISGPEGPWPSTVCRGVEREVAARLKAGEFAVLECHVGRKDFALSYSKVWDWMAPNRR